MRRDRLLFVAFALTTSIAPACFCGGTTYRRPYPAPTAAELVAHLDGERAKARSFKGESTMDYWLGDQRIKTTVLVMGALGAHIRFNALSPAGDTVAADLACDGQDFTFVDFQNDCQLVGVCDRDAIAQLLRISLAPDDFVLLSLGQVPALPGAKAAVRWDEDHGAEVLDLVAADGSHQRLLLDGRRGKTWDVVEATAWTASGAVDWKLANKDFHAVAAADGASLRVPGRTRFEQPSQQADLKVVWSERTLNLPLDDGKFKLVPPAGLPTCGAKKR